FAAALDNPTFTQFTVAASTRRGTVRTQRVNIALAAVALIATAAAVWAWTRPTPPHPVTRYALQFAPGQAPLADRQMAVSPDGSHLAYTGPGDGAATLIWLKARDREQAVPLAGTANAASFTFSPDGQSLAFVTATQQLRKI